MPTTIYTIGHSTRTIDELIGLLKHFGIEQVVDVRTVPRSRTNPQFNRDELERVLPEAGIDYVHMKDLGGLRKTLKDSPNAGWENDSFRGYADYMQTPKFAEAVSRLIEYVSGTGAPETPAKTTAIMCAEILPWRCHRSLIADALIIRGLEVIEIIDETESRPHKLTSFAVVDGQTITYPLSN